MRPLVIPFLCEHLVGDYLKGALRGLGHLFLRHALSEFEALGDPLGSLGRVTATKYQPLSGRGDCSPAASPRASESSQ